VTGDNRTDRWWPPFGGVIGASRHKWLTDCQSLFILFLEVWVLVSGTGFPQVSQVSQVLRRNGEGRQIVGASGDVSA